MVPKLENKTTHQALMLQIVSQQLVEVHILGMVVGPTYQENQSISNISQKYRLKSGGHN
jgi:hypothetical protein